MNLISYSPTPCPLALGDNSSSLARPVALHQVSRSCCRVQSFRNEFVVRPIVSPQLRLPRLQRFVCKLGASSRGELKSEAEYRGRELDLGDESRVGETTRRSETSSDEVTMLDFLDLEKQFSFYGSYHTDHVNVIIHMFFVWPLFFTNLILWAYTAAFAPLPLAGGTVPLQQYMVLNWSFVIAAIYALFYVALDKKAGSLGAAICLSCWIAANAIAQALSWSVAWKIVLAVQLISWAAQVYGHQKFEGRAPALLDNIAQAFLMAPFFVLLEGLVYVGYEPYPGFRKKVQKNVDDSIREYRAKKAKKSA